MPHIEITITALQYCLRGGLEAIPHFQQEHPAGSVLLLSLNGLGHEYPGSIAVQTEDFEPVGMVANEDLYRVRPHFGDLHEGGCVEVTVVRHEAKATICQLEGNAKSEPLMLHIDPQPGELILPYTERETLAQAAGNRAEQLLERLLREPQSITPKALQKLYEVLLKYVSECDYSLAADDCYRRPRIIDMLEKLQHTLTTSIPDLVKSAAPQPVPLPSQKIPTATEREPLPSQKIPTATEREPSPRGEETPRTIADPPYRHP